jgi:acetoacetyl-CoA synthetase
MLVMKYLTSSGLTLTVGVVVDGESASLVYAEEIQSPSIGMAIDGLDFELTEPVFVAAAGKAGVLVCRMPFPSEPVNFWGIKTDGRYRDT